MLQRSKILHSRDIWRAKAIQRGDEVRDLRKVVKRQAEKIDAINMQLDIAQTVIHDSKNTSVIPPTDSSADLMSRQQMRMVCILLSFCGVSFRSIPKILEVFDNQRLLPLSWVPHFTSVINWSLRLGLGLLNQVQPILGAWVAIADHSIDIGTKKALVVLRVPLLTLSLRGSAITLEDCECIGLKVMEEVNGRTVAQALLEVFKRAGQPTAVLKDCDATLNKGVVLLNTQREMSMPIIKDIGHVVAAALEAEYECTDAFQKFVKLLARVANRLRQTDLAFLVPPKLRSKGRFLSVSKLGQWAEKILELFAAHGTTEDASTLKRLRKAMPGFMKMEPFVRDFTRTLEVVTRVMEKLKNNGLDQNSYQQCIMLVSKLPEQSKVKKRLEQWLEEHISIQRNLTNATLLVSSDIIESLFGKFKYIIGRSPLADMNRTTLLIPTLCGKMSSEKTTRALATASHKDLNAWEYENIPYTVRKKRMKFFKDRNPKDGK